MNKFKIVVNGLWPQMSRCVSCLTLMELLVNGLLSQGARRERLEAKLFGGGRTMEGLPILAR